MRQFWIFVLLAAGAHSVWGQDTGDLSLESLLDAPVNAAAQYRQTAREAPAAVTVISSAEIDEFGYRTLADALAHVRGFYLSDDLETQYVGTRGFGRPGDFNNRVMVLIDGQAQNEAASGYIFLDERLRLNMDLVERIEVVRGPGSTLHGSGAMLAVVNVVTKAPETVADTRITATGGGSAETELQGRTGKVFDSGLGLVAWGKIGNRPGNLPTEQGMHFISSNQDWKHYSNYGLMATYGGLRVQAKHLDFSHGSPAAQFNMVFDSDTTRTVYGGNTFEAAYSADIGTNARLDLVGSVNSYLRRITLPFYYGDQEIIRRDKGGSLWYRTDAQFRLDTSPANRLSVGAQFRIATLDYKVWIADNVVSTTELGFHSVSGYVQDEYRFSSSLAATVGLRFDYYSQVGGAFSPRLAVVYNASSRSTFKFLYGGAFRAPNVEEFYSEDERINLITNPEIEPEYINTIEGVWEQEWSSGIASALSVYDYRLRGLIELSVNDQVGAMQFQNLGKANARGLELGISARAGSARMYGSAALQRARDGETSDGLWNSPNFLGKAGIAFRPGLPVRTGIQVRGESGRRTIRGTTTSGFVVVDVTLSSVEVLGHLRLGAMLRNALNQRYALPGTLSHIQPALDQAGRSFTVNLTYDL